jgi:ankyrin repeat domain-containing protein 50
MHDSDPYTAIAYYYFSFSETSKQSTTSLLSSLIRQLCGHRPDTPQPLLDLNKYRDRNQRPDLETLKKTFQATAADFQRVYVVIDALDECPNVDTERERLLDCLVSINGWGLPNLHMAFTSRNESDIQFKISPLLSPKSVAHTVLPPNSTLGVEIDLQEYHNAVNRDICSFIDQKLASSGFKTWKDALKSDAKKVLLEKADGM